MKQNRSAFSLLELLMVIGIIGILASLVLQATQQVKHHSRSTTCLSNLRQWGIATQLYLESSNDWLPPEGIPNPIATTTNRGWYVQLPTMIQVAPYHTQTWRTNAADHPRNSLWLCPENPRKSNGKNLFHYCLNESINKTGKRNRPINIDSIPQPSRTIWMFESKNLPAVGYFGFVHPGLHQNGAHFLFLDGHVSWYHAKDYWNEETGKGRLDNPELIWIP